MKFFLLVFLFITASIANASQADLYASYGFGERYDILADYQERNAYFGGILNLDRSKEVQLIVGVDGVGNSANGMHLSANYHINFFREVGPFVNIGLGLLTDASSSAHVNLDIGFQVAIKKVRFRIFHKSMNNFWSENQYNYGVIFLAAGIELGSL